MLGPVELPISPSCSDCLSWSADGELALAAGEYVHILTPKISREDQNGARSRWKSGRDQWRTTRFRANVFLDKDWPIGFPRPVNNFSIGAEQSISSVAALAWSPPGIAKYRRCILAVLTANLILSIWEPVGIQNKWTRVSIVNGALGDYFSPSLEDGELRRAKQRIRSFSWAPACRLSSSDSEPTALSNREDGYWGYYFLAAANDDSDIVLLQTRKFERDLGSPKYLQTEATAHFTFDALLEQYPNFQPDSLFAQSLNSKFWLSHMSWGPWIYEKTPEEWGQRTARSVIAVVQKSSLKFVQVDANYKQTEMRVSELNQRPQLHCREDRLVLQQSEMKNFNITGPLIWTYMESSSNITLAAAALGGLIIVKFPNGGYRCAQQSPDSQTAVVVTSEPFLGPNTCVGLEHNDEEIKHWDAVTAMTSTSDEHRTSPVIQTATVRSHIQSIRIPEVQANGDAEMVDQEPRVTADWRTQTAEFRDRFDLDYDLGGYAGARTWGLTSHHGWIAACFTLHPSDLPEYVTTSEERVTIIFSPPEQAEDADIDTALPWEVPSTNACQIEDSRRKALEFILRLDREQHFRNLGERKILYSTACCAIVRHSTDGDLLALSKSALQWLMDENGTDLTDEISQCTAVVTSTTEEVPNIVISPKSIEKMQDTGGTLFEACEICGEGIEWYSSEEAQCSEGHQFVRCGLTFLPIQEPDSSKFCSMCGAEYLDEELLAETVLHSHDGGYAHHTIFDTFDTCIYCGGKFRS